MSAQRIAQLYLERWTIEKHFQFLTQSLHCELPGLGKPKAALFGFAMALVAANALAAVRASMSIPFFYKPTHIKRNTFVDGGVLSNFPISIFDSSPQWPTFGIKLSSKEKAVQVPHKVKGPISLATSLFATMSSGHDQRHLDEPSTLARTIFVDTAKIQSTNFDINTEQQALLFANGQKAANRFVKNWDFTAFRRQFE